MKLIVRSALTLLAIYVAFWICLGAYFSFAEQHEELLESNLSTLFGREVTIDDVTTSWRGFSPGIQITNFAVSGDIDNQPALAFESLSAELDFWSILRFWPMFTDFAVRRPQLEIVSLDTNQLQIAGVKLRSKKSAGVNPKRLISWLINHQSIVWFDGEVVWRRLSGVNQHYSDISFVYERDQQSRSANATATTQKGAVAFKALANGNFLKESDWDASLEILGNQGQRLLAPEDLIMSVENGEGSLSLRALQIERVRDFLRLANISGPTDWILASLLDGLLHDVNFQFSGPLLEFKDWSLSARASDVKFNSVGPAPAMSNLSGRLNASADGGEFKFLAMDATFNWAKWFNEPLPISQAAGTLTWTPHDNGFIDLEIKNALFKDGNATIKNLNALCRIDARQNQIRNLKELQQVFKIGELDFDMGMSVGMPTEKSPDPVTIDASADFNVNSMAQIVKYFPLDRRVEKFRDWWENAVISGTASEGKIQYNGELDKQAIYEQRAKLSGQAKLTDVEMDYGFAQDWPLLKKGEGIVYLDNDLLTMEPTQAWLDDDQISNASISIDQLFKLERTLHLAAEVSIGLPKMVEFIFRGPLIKPENKPEVLPVTASAGKVSAKMDVQIPLQRVSKATVQGTATVTNGVALLPEGVPLTKLGGEFQFTERTVQSKNLRAEFLGGDLRAQLQTTEPAQPPKMRITANGTGDLAHLKPWIGEHLLTLFKGETQWQGALAIDGSQIDITAVSNMVGVSIDAPAPLFKLPETEQVLSMSMRIGTQQAQNLDLSLGETLFVQLQGDLNKENSLFDYSMISIGTKPDVKEGVNFHIEDPQINLDDWLSTLIDIASLETETQDDTFLNAMRSIKLEVDDPYFLGREFGALNLSAVSVDGKLWIGTINGDQVNGTIKAEPRADNGRYHFDLAKFHLAAEPLEQVPLEPIDSSLQPSAYPLFELNVASFNMAGRQLGNLELLGEPHNDHWQLSKLELVHHGMKTSATGRWVNDAATGTMTSVDYQTVINEAEDVLDDMALEGYLRKGEGTLSGNLNWIGAPHEFDYSRLNGHFDLRMRDGELIKIEPGSGKLVGLFNFNALVRRMTLDFRDIFAKGLRFNRMRFSGVFADGEAIMNDAFIFTPAVFVNMEGKLDIDKETIDMEIHMSPELGGNLTLLSALANPAAGAVVFLTQQIFKDEMRSSSFKSYRALGTWEDFEMVEFDPDKLELSEQEPAVEPTNEQLDPQQL